MRISRRESLRYLQQDNDCHISCAKWRDRLPGADRSCVQMVQYLFFAESAARPWAVARACATGWSRGGGRRGTCLLQCSLEAGRTECGCAGTRRSLPSSGFQVDKRVEKVCARRVARMRRVVGGTDATEQPAARGGRAGREAWRRMGSSGVRGTHMRGG